MTSIESLLVRQEEEQQQDLTKLEDFKEYLTDLDNDYYDYSLDKIVINIVSTLDTVSAQNNHLNYYINEKINRGYADEDDRKELLKELKQSVKEVKENVKRGKYSQGERELSDIIDDFPVPVSIKIPEGYILDKENGIYKTTINNDEPYNVLVYPFIVLPSEIIEDSSSTSNDKLVRLVKWNPVQERWQYHPYSVSLGKLTTSREITCLDGAGVVVVGDKYRKELANYFTELVQVNDGLRSLPTNEAIHTCGWTSEGLFFPYTTQEKGEDLIFTGKPGTTAYAIKQAVEKLPVGSIDKAKNIIHTLSDNAVFAIMLAGCLAAPLVPKMKGILDENIGIDLYGKTTSGKTAIQTLATNLIYGLGDELKASWAKAREAGIWRKAEAINNLPFILDDSHRIPEKLIGVPHDLINRKEGDKSTKTGDIWSSNDNTRDQYAGVLLFNGEVSISTKAPDDSAGIYGRIIMINHPPFPSNYDFRKVELLKYETYSNRGHFAKAWIEHIANLDYDKLMNEVAKISETFENKEADALYGRLVTKASLLVWCLQEFNKLFGVKVNVDKAIKLLKQSMYTATDSVNVADKIVKRIVETVFQDIVYYQAQGPTEAIMYNHFPTQNNNKINVVYKEGEYLQITLDVLKDILKGTSITEENAKNQLANAGYIEQASPKRHSRPKRPHEVKKPHMNGYKFKFEDIKDFIPEEAEYDESDDITVDTPAIII